MRTCFREMIGFAAERLMELEVGAVTGAAYGEKHPGRRAQRNGYRDRNREVRRGRKRSSGSFSRRTAGTVELRIPKLRKGSYFPWTCTGFVSVFCERSSPSRRSEMAAIHSDEFKRDAVRIALTPWPDASSGCV